MKKILSLLIAVILITETTLAGYSSSRSYGSSRSYSSPSRSSSSYKSYSTPSKTIKSSDVKLNTVNTRSSVKNILNKDTSNIKTTPVKKEVKQTPVKNVVTKETPKVKQSSAVSVSNSTNNNNNNGGFGFWNYVFFWTLFSSSNNASSNNTTGVTLNAVSSTGSVTPLTETKIVEKDFSIIEWCKSLFN